MIKGMETILKERRDEKLNIAYGIMLAFLEEHPEKPFHAQEENSLFILYKKYMDEARLIDKERDIIRINQMI